MPSIEKISIVTLKQDQIKELMDVILSEKSDYVPCAFDNNKLKKISKIWSHQYLMNKTYFLSSGLVMKDHFNIFFLCFSSSWVAESNLAPSFLTLGYLFFCEAINYSFLSSSSVRSCSFATSWSIEYNYKWKEFIFQFTQIKSGINNISYFCWLGWL